MATKKKITKSVKKKKAKRKVAKKKVTKKKKSTKTSAKASSAGKKTPKKRKPSTPSSVDGILKKYEKERMTLDTTMTTVRKKIEDLEKKANDCLERIDVLSVKERDTAKAIGDLNSRRDNEVSALLAKLGVSFAQPSEEPESLVSSSSRFEETDSNPDSSDQDSDSESNQQDEDDKDDDDQDDGEEDQENASSDSDSESSD